MRSLRAAGALTLLAFGSLGCGGTHEIRAATRTTTVEIFSWWYSKSEGEALQAVTDIYERDHPGVIVFNAAETGEINAVDRLEQRMAQGLPPDAFQSFSGVPMMEWVKFNGIEGNTRLEPIDDIAAAGGWLSAVPKPILDTVMHDGHVYAVPMNIHRANYLYYNKKVFADSGLTPPTNLDELYAVTDALAKKNGVTPISLSSKQSAGPGVAMWENIFLLSAGPDYYEAFFKGQKSPHDPEVKAALEAGLKVLANVNDNAEQILWQEAVELLGSGGAAMHLNGDWVKAELEVRGYKLDVDFGMVPMRSDSFVYIVDSFVLPKGAVHRDLVRDLLATMGSVKGQDAFNPIKGSIAARTDTDRSLYDTQSQQAIDDARNPATHFVPSRNNSVPFDYFAPVDDAFKEYLRDKDTNKMIAVMESYYDKIKAYYGQP